MTNKNMRIVISAPDDRVADRSVSEIMEIAKRTKTEFRGPIPLVVKDGKENRREIDVVDPSFRFTEEINKTELPSTADVEISFF